MVRRGINAEDDLPEQAQQLSGMFEKVDVVNDVPERPVEQQANEQIPGLTGKAQ